LEPPGYKRPSPVRRWIIAGFVFIIIRQVLWVCWFPSRRHGEAGSPREAGTTLERLGQMAKKILVIEDELHVSNYLQEIFQDHGYQTVGATEASQALEMARAERPDLITLDLQMPQEHGTKFFRSHRKDSQIGGIPIVVITGQSSPHRAIKPDKAAAIVQKPFDPQELVSIVRGVIGEA
jgi:CheY-like chemotaxis protein